MAAKTTKEVAWLTGAAKDDNVGLLAGGTGALTSTSFTVQNLLGNDPGSASLYGVYATFTPYANASTKTPLAAALTCATSMGGSITVNKATGAISYVPPASVTADMLKALPAGAMISDTFYYVIWMAEKGAYSLAKASVNMTGIDDAATITGTLAGAVVEDVTTSFSGNLSIVDPDTGESGFPSQSIAGSLGTLTIVPGATGSGATPGTATWVYELSHELADSLAEGETVVETFTVASLGPTSVTVTVTVTGTNDAPVAAADVASTSENAAITIDVLANDGDVDHGAALTVVSASSSAGSGSVSVEGNQVVFDPGTDFDHLALGAERDVTVTYTMADEHGAQSSSTVTITVTGENDGPTAHADTATTGENDPISIDALENDTDPDDGAQLTIVSAGAAKGLVGISADGKSIEFDPGTEFDHLAAGVEDEVIITYDITDEHGATSSSTVTLTIVGANDAATITGDKTGIVSEDGVLTAQGDLLVHDVDDGENVLGAHGSLAGTYGDFVLSGGHWSYTLRNADAAVQALNTGDVVSDTLQVSSFDGTASATIQVGIHGLTDEAVNLSQKWIVNHGQDTINERFIWLGFDSNDYMKFSKNLTYTPGSYQQVGSDTVVTFHYKTAPEVTIQIVLVGYNAADFNEGFQVT